MTPEELMEALGPVLAGLGVALTTAQWALYHRVLEDVNPGDLDDGMVTLCRTHAFRNAPLPADILRHCDEAKRLRVAAGMGPRAPLPTADPSEGEWRTFTLAGIGSVRLHVLPDDHPALPRYACGRCQDTSWEAIPNMTDTPRQPTVRRCGCWQSNPVIARRRRQQAERTQARGPR